VFTDCLLLFSVIQLYIKKYVNVLAIRLEIYLAAELPCTCGSNQPCLLLITYVKHAVSAVPLRMAPSFFSPAPSSTIVLCMQATIMRPTTSQGQWLTGKIGGCNCNVTSQVEEHGSA